MDLFVRYADDIQVRFNPNVYMTYDPLTETFDYVEKPEMGKTGNDEKIVSKIPPVGCSSADDVKVLPPELPTIFMFTINFKDSKNKYEAHHALFNYFNSLDGGQLKRDQLRMEAVVDMENPKEECKEMVEQIKKYNTTIGKEKPIHLPKEVFKTKQDYVGGQIKFSCHSKTNAYKSLMFEGLIKKYM